MAFGFAQHTGSAVSSATSATIVVPVTNAPAAGNMLVIAVNSLNQDLVSVTDTKGNTWTIVSHFSIAASPVENCLVAYTLQDAGTLTGTDTVTATITTAIANIAATVDEFTIAAGTIGVDLSPVNSSTGVTASGTTSTAISVGASQATTAAAELVLCVASARGSASQTFTAGSGWTKTSSIVKSSGQFPGSAIEYQVTSATGAQTGTWTLGVSSSGGWAAVLVSFKATVGATNWVIAGITMR